MNKIDKLATKLLVQGIRIKSEKDVLRRLDLIQERIDIIEKLRKLLGRSKRS